MKIVKEQLKTYTANLPDYDLIKEEIWNIVWINTWRITSRVIGDVANLIHDEI